MSSLSDEELCVKVIDNANLETLDAFNGVYALDELPNSIPNRPIFFIVNTQTHNLKGEHWKVLFIDGKGNGEVFDSLAQPMNAMLTRFMSRFTRQWRRNYKVYQHPNSTTCGAFALFYVLKRLDFPSMIALTNCFSSSLYANECLVRDFYEKLK